MAQSQRNRMKRAQEREQYRAERRAQFVSGSGRLSSAGIPRDIVALGTAIQNGRLPGYAHRLPENHPEFEKAR